MGYRVGYRVRRTYLTLYPTLYPMPMMSARRADLWFPAHPPAAYVAGSVLKTTLDLRKAIRSRVVFKPAAGGGQETTEKMKRLKRMCVWMSQGMYSASSMSTCPDSSIHTQLSPAPFNLEGGSFLTPAPSFQDGVPPPLGQRPLPGAGRSPPRRPGPTSGGPRYDGGGGRLRTLPHRLRRNAYGVRLLGDAGASRGGSISWISVRWRRSFDGVVVAAPRQR